MEASKCLGNPEEEGRKGKNRQHTHRGHSPLGKHGKSTSHPVLRAKNRAGGPHFLRSSWTPWLISSWKSWKLGDWTRKGISLQYLEGFIHLFIQWIFTACQA